MYKKLYLSGIAVYLFLIAFAVIFYKERIIFLDTAFAMFHLVKDGEFCIQIMRFGDAVPQIFPLLAYKAGLSLDAITLWYSIGLVSFYAACYLICGFGLKQYRFALVILLINILFAAHTFYWPISQVPLGMALFMVLLSVLCGREIKTIRWPIAILIALLVITLVFFHPLMIIVLFYCGGFFVLRMEDGMNKRLLYAVAMLFASVVIVKMVFFRVPYERHSLSGLKNFVRLFPDYFTIYSNRQFLANCISNYYWLPVVFVWVIAGYLKKRNYLHASLVAMTSLGYLMLVNICYPDADTPQFYIENLYLPLSVFIGLPFVFETLPGIRNKYLPYVLFLAIAVSGTYRIYATHDLYTARLNWERDFLRKHGSEKVIADSKKADAAILQMLWGTPYEFWLLSTIETGKTASIIIDDDPHHRDWAREKTKEFIVNWNVFLYGELNPRYFRLTDSASGYVIDPPLK